MNAGALRCLTRLTPIHDRRLRKLKTPSSKSSFLSLREWTLVADTLTCFIRGHASASRTPACRQRTSGFEPRPSGLTTRDRPEPMSSFWKAADGRICFSLSASQLQLEHLPALTSAGVSHPLPGGRVLECSRGQHVARRPQR